MYPGGHVDKLGGKGRRKIQKWILNRELGNHARQTGRGVARDGGTNVLMNQ